MYGVLGKVSAVYEANGNDLLAVDHKGREVLVPIRDEFIVDFNKESKTILVNLPDGLLDIYLEP
jgi:16S rRNA processing protein RimM